MANGILLAVRKESLQHTCSSHALSPHSPRTISKTLLITHTKSKQSGETSYDLDFHCNTLVSRHRKLRAGRPQDRRTTGPGSLASFALRPLLLHCVLCCCTVSGHPRAKMVIAALDGLLPHRGDHRQNMAVCPSSPTFIREAALSCKQLYQTFCLPSQNKVKCPPHLAGEGNTRISLDKLQVLSPAGERPLAGEQRRKTEGKTSWVGNQQYLLSFKLLHGLSTNLLSITVIPKGGDPTT